MGKYAILWKEEAVAERSEEIRQLADGATTNKKKLASLVKQLSDASRRDRQIAASAIHQVAKVDAARLVDYTEVIIDALNRPEAQTRWESLETLALIIDHDSRTCSKAIPEAETALFDEESGPVRLAAMRFLCKLDGRSLGKGLAAHRRGHSMLSWRSRIQRHAGRHYRFLDGQAERPGEGRAERAHELRCDERQGLSETQGSSNHRQPGLASFSGANRLNDFCKGVPKRALSL